MCWVGLAEPDHTVRPIAARGFDEGDLERIRMRWDDSLEGGGPAGTSIRTGRTIVVESIRLASLNAPWRNWVLKRGCLSLASIPLKTEKGEAIGVCQVYSTEEHGFDPEEVRTLEAFTRQCTMALVNARRMEDLRDAHQRLSIHDRQMPLGHITLDREFRVAGWNPAAEGIFGWTADEVKGKRPFEFLELPKAQAHSGGVFSKFVEGDDSSFSLDANLRKDGKTISCEWFVTRLRDTSGNVSGMCAMAHDVTEKTQLRKQLQTAQRMEVVGTLAGGIAHDFNNMLTVILGFGEMIKLRIANDPKAVSDIDQVLVSAERASVLTRQLLTFARRQIIELSNIDLDQVVNDLERLLRKVTREDIEIRTIPSASPVTIRADRGQIEQVLMNLCLNSRDAMPEGGRLVIETGETLLEDGYLEQHPYMKAGRYAVLSVSDTGTGMDEKTRERIFEPFFTTKGPDKGTGLGLAMVYGIVKQHNGFIHVYSEPGLGTTFRVYIPEVDVPADAKVAASQGPARGGSETILLAEDNESVRHFTEQMLVSYGYRVMIACDGEEALAIFRRHGKEIAMVVLDVVMPKMGGKQAYDEMMKISPKMKVLFLSGYAANAIHESFVLLPGFSFLQKPFGPNVLANKVRDVLDRK